GKVSFAKDGTPYIEVSEAAILPKGMEPMVSVLQILLDPIGMSNRRVGLLGVLAKGYDSHGKRLYFLADPTGAITLGRLPKLYPKGTILRINGLVRQDENGLPELADIEIISAKN
ncbi:hypothetical protein HYY75_06995, partial [bacterium]|nr:hypothetical protein [bacterium]